MIQGVSGSAGHTLIAKKFKVKLISHTFKN